MAVAVVLAACGPPKTAAPVAEDAAVTADAPDATVSAPTSEPMPTTVVHTNGLSLAVPPGVTATETEDGYRLTPSDADARRQVDVTEVSLEGEPPDEEWSESQSIGEREFRYIVEDQGSGSGGTHWRLTGYAEIGDRVLVAVHETQAELAPNFDPLWELLAGAERSSELDAPAPADSAPPGSSASSH